MSPAENYRHLELTRLQPVNPRRTRGGFGILPEKQSDVVSHGNLIGSQFEHTEQMLLQKKPKEFDLDLIMKLQIQPGTITEKTLRSFGIDLIAEEGDRTIVVFVTAEAKKVFFQRLERYKQGETGGGVSANFFHAIEGVTPWERENRLGRTLKNIQWSADEKIVVDIELWPRESRDANRKECDQVVKWLEKNNGEVWDAFATGTVVLLRARLSGAMLDDVLNLETVRVVDLPPALSLETSDFHIGLKDILIRGPQEGTEVPTVAVLDSGIVGGHPVIAPALGEAASFVQGQKPGDETGHGTAVAGFSLYGDIEKCIEAKEFIAQLRLLSGKVLVGRNDEYDRKLIAHQVKDAVEYFYDNLGCRIFNISFGDSQQPYDDLHVKGLAAILDEIARERGVLFVVSAGNFRGTEAIPSDWRQEYPHYLFNDGARIIDPAPALNVITVGSLARYDLDYVSQRFPKDVNHQPIARVDELSPFTRTGPGPNGAIKPDVVDYGGNSSIDLRTSDHPQPTFFDDPNLSEVAVNYSFADGRLFRGVIGTSFAAPKVTHIAGRLLAEYPDASSNLLRALIVLHSLWPKAAESFLDGEGRLDNESPYRCYGYGRPVLEKILFSQEQCVTLVAEDKIGRDQTHFYEIPLPDDFLSSGKIERSIRFALAHCPPCRSTRRSYRGSKISFKIVLEDDVEKLMARFKQNSDLENISEWGGLEPGNQLRSKGTVMAVRKTLKQFSSTSPLLRGKRIFVVVTHQVPDWAIELISEEEPYALVAAIEDKEREDVKLYSQLRARLRPRARIRL